MGSTNFLQFNPTQANQETDAEYAVDSTRTGGAGVDGIWPSPSANKTLYQGSTAFAGLMQMMANKGFVVSDANLATLTAVLANILTTADVQAGLQSVAYAPSITLNTAAYNGFEITLAGNTTLSTTGVVAGQVILLFFVQDATGGRTITFSGFSGAAQPDPTASTISAQLFKVNAALVAEAISPLMSASGINNTPIGAAAAASGDFTSLTANTPASSDDSTNAATTAWAKNGFLSMFGTNGYFKMPAWLGGFTLQWGLSLNPSGVDTAVSFPISFSNACLQVQLTTTDNATGGGGDRISYVLLSTVSAAGFTWSTNGTFSSGGAFWFAIGY